MAEQFRYSGNIYKPDANTTDFALTSSEGKEIAYLEKSHIQVSKSTDEGDSWTELSRPDDWDFSTDGKTVKLATGTSEGDWIKVKRNTPYSNRYTTFQPSSNLTSDQLNEGEDFSMFVDQELSDNVAEALAGGGIGDAPDDGSLYGRKSKAWSKVPDPGVEEAPIDNKEYVRVNQSWKEIPEDQTGVPEAPINSKTFARKDASWVEINDAGGINYKGTRDLTLAAPAAVSGDFYVNTATTGTVDDSWTGLGGQALTGAERVVYDGASWEMLPMPPTPAPTGVVEEVVAGNDIVVNSGNPAKPVVSVKDGVFLKSFEVKAGTNITVVGGDTVSVTNNSFLPYDISTLDPLPTP